MRKDIAFETEDRVTLRGWHYVPEKRQGKVPTIVMAHGFSAVKEMYLDRFAEAFATAEYASIVFDNPEFGGWPVSLAIGPGVFAFCGRNQAGKGTGGGPSGRPLRVLDQGSAEEFGHHCSRALNCSAMGRNDLKKVTTSASIWRTWPALPWVLVMVIVAWLARVCRPTPYSSSGRLVMASVCWFGSASRTNNVHQL